MNAQKLIVVLGLGASFVALAYPEVPTNHAATSPVVITPPSVGSDAPIADVLGKTPATPDAAQDAGQADGVSFVQKVPTIYEQYDIQAYVQEIDALKRKIAEQSDTIAALQEQITRLTVPQTGFVEKPKPVVKAQPVSYGNYSSCGAGGCGNGIFRGRIFGRRR